MAERRMFAKTIVLSDAFLDMPLGARCLYMTMGMLADDDGFVNSPKAIIRQTGATEDDLKILIAKRFIIPFESGVIVIKHWRINNYLQSDRYKQTVYQEEKALLTLDEKGSYSENVYTDTVYTGKDSIGKDSKGNNKRAFVPPTLEEVEKYAKQRKSNVNPRQFYEYFTETNWTDTNGKKVRSWKGKFITWEGYRANGKQPIVYDKPEIEELSTDDLTALTQRMKEEGENVSKLH